MKRSLIVAVAENGVIGRDNQLPWRLREDLRRFKRLTMGHHLIMGRRTFESIGKPLPGRTTIVVSRGKPELPDEILLAASIDEALERAAANGETEVFFAGGVDVFAQAMEFVDRIYLTRVHGAPHGDRTLPSWPDRSWRLIDCERVGKSERDEFRSTFQIFESDAESHTESAQSQAATR